MKTQYYTATSLDGFIATEDDSLDWLFPLGDISDTSYPEFIAGVGALAMGSTTYEWILRHADEVAAEAGSPWPYAQPAWIFTRRVLPVIEGADTRFVRGDVRPETKRDRPRFPVSMSADLLNYVNRGLSPVFAEGLRRGRNDSGREICRASGFVLPRGRSTHMLGAKK